MVKTRDLALAGYLLAKGRQIDAIEQGSRGCVFQFGNATEEDVVRFLNDDMVGVRSFANALRDLRDSIARSTPLVINRPS